jgi:flagellar biosynthesis/type III secretory pathway M-ring protein FliF/YscJ
LAAERVVVVDGFGAPAGAVTLPDKAASRETRLQNSIQRALDSVFGAGAALVRVSVRNAGEEHSVQSTRVTPHGLLEAESGNERGSGGGKSYERQRNRTRYAYDTIVDTRSAHGDAISRISVAVFLDARRMDLSQSKLVTDLVRASAGADLSSGDEVVVAALPFYTKSSPLIQPSKPSRIGFGKVAAPAAVVSLFIVALALTRLRSRTGKSADDHAAAELQTTLSEELPQTVAYVLRSLPVRMRQRVLRAYDVQQRERIMWHLNGRADG